MRRVVVCLACAACGRIDFTPTDSGESVPDACATLGAFGAPVPVAGINSTSDDWVISLTGDERTAFFASWRGGFGSAIWTATRSDRTVPFETPTLVTEVTTPPSDQGPVISFDGLTLVVASNRVGSIGSYDFFAFSRPDMQGPFTPGPSFAELNSASYESRGWLSRDGLRFYFSSARSGNDDLYLATRPDSSSMFGTPTALSELNTNVVDDGPALSVDELEIYFTSTRPGGVGMEDIWYATRASTADPFSTPQNLTIVSSSRDDTGVWLSSDRRTLYLNYDALESGGANADVWASTRPCL